MSLDFDEDRVNFVIDGENRDEVFLLFSELKEYLSNEVSTKKWTPSIFQEFFMFLPLLLLFLAMVILFFGVQSSNISDESLDNILHSDDVNEKLNFLIQTNSKDNFPYKIGIYILTPLSILLMIFRKNLAQFTSYFFPCNLFLFGKEIGRYKKRLDFRGKLFWIIFVGLILSVIGSYIVSKIH